LRSHWAEEIVGGVAAGGGLVANGDFSRELRLTCPKVVFSATT